MPPFFQDKSLLSRFIFLLLFMVGGMLIFTAFGQLLGTLIYHPADSSHAELSPGYYRLVQIFSEIGMFLIPAILFSYCTTKNGFDFNYANKGGKPLLFGLVLLLSVVLFPATYFLAFLNDAVTFPEVLSGVETWMREMEISQRALIAKMTMSTSSSVLILNIGVFAILPAICEEFFFRGTLQPFLTRCFKNHHVAIIVTAFVFSAIHLQFFGFIPRFLLGIYLGYLLLWSGTLWLPITAHFLHNFISIMIQFLALRRGLDVEDPNVIDLQAYIPVIIVSFICTAIGIYILRRKRIVSPDVTWS